MPARVYITITYGTIEDAVVLNAVEVAAEKLRKEGVEPSIVQVYMPGSRLRISVNGVELEADEELVDRIIDTVYEALIEEDIAGNRSTLTGYAAAAVRR